MKTKLTLVGLALVCAFTLSAKPQSKSQAWEYKFQYQCDEKKANNVAAEGWELVTMTHTGSTSLSVSTVCAFKRPK